jgi:hypothetical protein
MGKGWKTKESSGVNKGVKRLSIVVNGIPTSRNLRIVDFVAVLRNSREYFESAGC